MYMKRKTKDNIKAIIDITLFFHRNNMELVYDESRVVKPKPSLALSMNSKLLVYKWLKTLRVPDGYALNILRLVNLEDFKLYRMNSHDYFYSFLGPTCWRFVYPHWTKCRSLAYGY